MGYLDLHDSLIDVLNSHGWEGADADEEVDVLDAFVQRVANDIKTTFNIELE